MADSQAPAQPETPRPKTASLPDHQRWWEVVERALVAVAEKPVMALSSDPETESGVSSAPTVDAVVIPPSVNDARPKGDTPWTGEAAPEAVDAQSVVDSAASGVGLAARSRLPDRPWGDPGLRLAFWLVVSVILVAAAIVLIFSFGAAWIPVGLAAIVAVARALRGVYISRLEWGMAQAPRSARKVEQEPPSSPGNGPASGEASGGGPVAAA